jgi:hypothetical protein
MAGTKAISKPGSKPRSKLRPGKNVSLNVAKAIRNLESAKKGHSEVLDSYDTLEQKYDDALKNMTYAEKRKNLIKTVEERADELDRQNKQREKDIGASKLTVQTLKYMAADSLTFIRLCDRWNRGEPGVKTSKKVFEELMAAEKIELDGTMTEAWRNRPVGCEGIRSALLHYSKQFVDIKKTKGSEFLVPGDRPLINIDQEKAAVDPVAMTVMTKLESITRALKKLDEAKSESKLNDYFPGCFGFCRRQQATQELRNIEFHRGGKMNEEEMYSRFPDLIPLPKAKAQAPDLEPGPSSVRPPSPSLVDYKKLEAAEREVQRLKMLNDQEEDEDDDDDEEDDGGYEGEQGDLFRQVFGGDGEGEETASEAEPMEEAEPAEEPAEEPEPSVDAAQSDSENETTSEDSNWKHDDVDMMFAEAMAAREA